MLSRHAITEVSSLFSGFENCIESLPVTDKGITARTLTDCPPAVHYQYLPSAAAAPKPVMHDGVTMAPSHAAAPCPTAEHLCLTHGHGHGWTLTWISHMEGIFSCPTSSPHLAPRMRERTTAEALTHAARPAPPPAATPLEAAAAPEDAAPSLPPHSGHPLGCHHGLPLPCP